MADPDQSDYLARLEAENERLRHLLRQHGMPSTLRHQVRNTLGIMRALMRRSAGSKETIEDFAAHLEGRFDALLRVQTMLVTKSEDVDLYTLISNELLAYTIRDDDTAHLVGPIVRIPARYAELMGLAVHELTTNAIKFGALTTPGGRLDIAWTLAQRNGRVLTLTWVESGLADAASQQPIERGFGLEAIEDMLPYQLNAESTLDWRPGGLHCTIRLPLPPL